jgi:hypothetical protein
MAAATVDRAQTRRGRGSRCGRTARRDLARGRRLDHAPHGGVTAHWSADLEPGIEIEIVYFDDDLVDLQVRASNGRFTATAELYEALDVFPSLAGTLAGFPTSPADVRERILGNVDPACGEGGVRLRFACTDSLGHAAVHLTVRARGCGALEGGEVADFKIPVDPASIDKFVEQLRSAEVRKGQRAHLLARC